MSRARKGFGSIFFGKDEWPTMNEMLEEWKSEYGDIFLTEINDVQFIFRLLNYQEYETLAALAGDQIDLDEMICQVSILDPIVEDWTDEIFAGYSSSLSQVIREESLISPREEDGEEEDSNDVVALVKAKSAQIENSFILQLPVIIMHTFPQYRLDEIQEMSLVEQVDLYVRASWAIKNLNAEGIELTFDNE